MKTTVLPAQKRITGQVIYVGPMVPSLGLQYGNIFRNGIHAHLYEMIGHCPSFGELFVPVKQYAVVRRELNFDLGRNMRGTTGKYVAFYRETQNFLASVAIQVRQPATTQQEQKIHDK